MTSSPSTELPGERIVISGVGLVTCLGLTSRETWQRLLNGERGIGNMPALECRPSGGDKPGGNGGQAPELPPDWMTGRPREVRYLRWAIDEAMREAGAWAGGGRAPRAERCACVLGTTLHGMRQGGEFLRTGNFEPLCSFLASQTLGATLQGLPVGGLVATNCSACSSGLGAIALGVTLLKSGQADVVIAGGYDPVSEYAYAGFDSMRLVAPGDLKPFCRGREGMKLAEGYAALVLERESDAAARGAVVLAVVGGIGESADSHHLTQPHPEGEGALRAISAAMKQSGLSGADIGLIAAHATATPNNDASEFAALSRAMGQRLKEIPLVAFKSHLGHTLGAAGGAELILSLLAMRDQVAPPTAGVAAEELEYPELSIQPRARRAAIDATLNTSLGFGGANTCVVLTQGRADSRVDSRRGGGNARSWREVLITGAGFLAPGMIGNAAFAERLAAPEHTITDGTMNEEEYSHLINARRVRRLSEYSKLTLAATTLACQSAGIADLPVFAEECAAILGTMHGSAQFCRDYYGPIVEQGMGAANPVLFAEGVPNAASAQLSLMLGIKGCCQTIIGSRTAGLDALRLAALRIASGEWDRAIVGAAEENVQVLRDAYARSGLRSDGGGLRESEDASGFLMSSGAVSLVLESRASLERRGGEGSSVLGTVTGGASGHGDLKAGGPELVSRVLADLGDVGMVVSSANGTWLDRVEQRGLEASAARRAMGVIRVTSMYGVLAEMFSVGPLASIAGMMLAKRLPIPKGSWGSRGLAAHDGPVRGIVGVLASDWSGVVSGVTVDVLP